MESPKKVNIEFEGVRSRDQFLKDNYFANLDRISSNGSIFRLREYVLGGVQSMIHDQVIPNGNYTINDANDNVTVTASSKGLSLNTSINSDLTQKTVISICNPFGKGGELGGEASLGLYRSILGGIYFKDRFQNRIELSKKVESPSNYNHFVRTMETSLVVQPKNIGSHFFSLYTGVRQTSPTGADKDDELKNHTGLSQKLSLLHKYYYRGESRKGNGYWGKITSEFAGGSLGTLYFKSETLNHYYLNLEKYAEGLYLECMVGCGGLYNFTKGLSPYCDRFFNGQSYHLKGFNYKGLATTKNKKTCFGGDYYHSSSIYLTKEFSTGIQAFTFYSIGNSILSYNNLKDSITRLFSPSSFRHTIGIGIRVDMGPALVDVYLSSVVKKQATDSSHYVGFNATLKL